MHLWCKSRGFRGGGGDILVQLYRVWWGNFKGDGYKRLKGYITVQLHRVRVFIIDFTGDKKTKGALGTNQQSFLKVFGWLSGAAQGPPPLFPLKSEHAFP